MHIEIHTQLKVTSMLNPIDQLNWIADDVTHALSTISSKSDMAPAIDIRLYVTTAAADTQSFEGEDRPPGASDPEAPGPTVVGTDPNPSIARAENIDPTAKDRLLAVPGVQLIYGRPDIKGIVGTEIAEARGAVGITGGCLVFSCHLSIDPLLILVLRSHSLRNGRACAERA
jgi:hypothetical protein